MTQSLKHQQIKTKYKLSKVLNGKQLMQIEFITQLSLQSRFVPNSTASFTLGCKRTCLIIRNVYIQHISTQIIQIELNRRNC